MKNRSIAFALGLGLVVTGSSGAVAAAGPAAPLGVGAAKSHVEHVLLLSVDGLHASDLAWYIRQHRTSPLAHLVAQGTDYTNARTTFPSDSFPGMVAS